MIEDYNVQAAIKARYMPNLYVSKDVLPGNLVGSDYYWVNKPFTASEWKAERTL